MKSPEKLKKKAEERFRKLSYDWYSSGYYPWRIPLFMGLFAVAMAFVFSFVDISYPKSKSLDAHPESVFLLSDSDLSRLAYDPKMTPLTSRGPVWADPVSSGIEGDMYFPLNSGLYQRSKPKMPEMDESLTDSSSLVGWLVLPSPRVDAWLASSSGDEVKSRVSPVFAAWSDELEEFRLPADLPSSEADLRGMQTVFWVRVNEWGTPLSLTLIQSSGNEDADKYAETALKSLRWNPKGDGRLGVVCVDWEEVGRP